MRYQYADDVHTSAAISAAINAFAIEVGREITEQEQHALAKVFDAGFRFANNRRDGSDEISMEDMDRRW